MFRNFDQLQEFIGDHYTWRMEGMNIRFGLTCDECVQ